MKILAIDASTKSSGVAIYENGKLIYSNCYQNNSADLINRIEFMVAKIKGLIAQYQPIDKIVLEEVLPDKGRANLKTHKALMWLQAAIAMMVHDNFKKTEIEYLYPSEWRSTIGIHTGRGIKRTELKEKDIKFVKDTFNLRVNDDEADAILIGYSYIKPKKENYNWE